MMSFVKYRFPNIKPVLVKYGDGKEEAHNLLWVQLLKDEFAYFISGPTVLYSNYHDVKVTELDGSPINLTEAVI